MITVSDEQFQALADEAFGELPKTHLSAVRNVALVYAEEPNIEQRETARLRHDQTLFGLYEGVPLPRRQGATNYPPDKITLFKLPLCRSVDNFPALKEQIKHTLWHEVAHYFGLDHDRIAELEG
ncbi:MAG TPA: metallopeptidase family protein [Candidatus Saccharimonadales bacterium]|nr:metallopeptidase family protein [Candidatus Saccharimonadales bacterium]